jgi:uncharacterized protein
VAIDEAIEAASDATPDATRDATRDAPRGPVTTPRIELLDALRGLALMGILQVNIQSFTWGAGDPLGYLSGPPQRVDTVLYFLQAAFLEGKFYPIFAFLFGAGMALQLRTLRRRWGNAGALRIYRRRLLVLLGLGIAHGFLLYSGDVLSAYAICALGFSALLPDRPRALVAVATACCALALASLFLPVWIPDPRDGGLLPGALPQDLVDAHEVYVHQTYFAQLGQRRIDETWQQLGSVLDFWPQVLALFSLGALAGRQGWMRDPQRHRIGWRRAGIIGLAFGLPCALVGAAMTTARARAAPGSDGQWDAVLLGGSSLLAATYLWAAVSAYGRPWGRRIGHCLAYAGRMSLSNYVLQSLAMGALLSGWGMALGDRVSRAQLALLGLLLFCAQLCLSRWWLMRFGQGPLEALWRRITYGAKRAQGPKGTESTVGAADQAY